MPVNAEFTDLLELHIAGAQVTDSGFQSLGRLRKLRNLLIGNSAISDETLL